MGVTDSLLSTLAPLATAAPYHLLAYGTLLGTELYQVCKNIVVDSPKKKLTVFKKSFVMTKICFKALPISAFTTLQKRVFPAYFQIQNILILLTAVTYPPYGPYSLVRNSTGDAITLVFAGAMALLNLTVYGPRTQEAMIARIHQGQCSLLASMKYVLRH